jgi:hypothetical protein
VVAASSALLLLGAGCLYLDGVNHAPVARLDVMTEIPTPLNKHHPLQLAAVRSFDPDGSDTESLTYEWVVDGRPAATDNTVTFVPQGFGERAAVTFKTAGEHTVAVRAVDRHSARSLLAQTLFLVEDAVPKAKIKAVLGNMSGCKEDEFIVGSHVELSAETMGIDPDDEVHTYKWRVIERPSGSTMASLTGGHCDESAPAPGMLEYPAGSGRQDANIACLRTDVSGDFVVELFVDDGASRPVPKEEQRITRKVIVGPDRPPCMDGFDPTPNSYVLDRNATPQTAFTVTEVRDDLDSYPASFGGPTFVWSVWHERDPVWRTVPNYPLHTYTLDPTAYLVDEKVRLRVMAQDRVPRAAPTCDEQLATCPLSHDHPTEICFPEADRCQAWVTWDVRFR